MKEFYCLAQQPNFRKASSTPSTRLNAPTIISLFYYETSKRPLDTYMRRMQNLADMGEQTIIYVPPTLAQQVKAMRDDVHWCVVDDYKTFPLVDYEPCRDPPKKSISWVQEVKAN